FTWLKIFKAGQADHLKFLFHDFFNLIAGLVSMLQKWQRNVLTHRERREQRAGLEQHSESQTHAFNLALLHCGNFFSKKFHGARSRFHGANHVPEQCALAATAAAHNDERLASMNVERDIIEHCAITESPDEMTYLDEGFAVGIHALKKKIPVNTAFITSIASKACTTEPVVA